MKPNATGRLWLILLGIPPVGWLGLHLAPYMGQGLAGIAAALQQAMVHPFEITIVSNSMRTVAICLAVYSLAVGIACPPGRIPAMGRNTAAQSGEIHKAFATATGSGNIARISC